VPATSSHIRYCIHVPILYNAGRTIEDTKLDFMVDTLKDRFGGYTKSPQTIPFEGYWEGPDGEIYYDKVFLMYIDAIESGGALEFLVEFKRDVAAILDQKEIYIVSWPIEIL